MNGGLVGDPQRVPRAGSRWGDLGLRVVSAAVLAPVVLLCIWFGGIAFVALMFVAAVGLSVEWVGLCATPLLGFPGGFVLVAVLAAGALAIIGWPGYGILLLLAFWAVLGRKLLSGGVLYVGLALVALLFLRDGVSVSGRMAVLFVIFVVWASDIGAYAFGRMIGGAKLAPSLSPAKTWSGAIGGLLTAVVVAQIVVGRASAAVAVVAAMLAISCQIGDLLESGIKRHVGVKDSGRLIPGHGGLLDRLDGLLAASPVAALVVLAGRGDIFWR